MAQNPDVQRKAQEEIDAVVGPEQLPTLSGRGRLPYVEAVIKEVLRWRPAVPLGIPRRVGSDDMYEGYRIPSDSIIISNVWAISRDVNPKYPASEFIPERFLDENPLVDPASYVFGFGRR
ncbi:hypothetical protein VKT23_016792 [Stygiomarasmius scandens]|uniref:Cytochrome P450 n=1 Tax=Marasmiellus scandens TaxID=2682957 RepID=A0ABR1ITW8_9AGAR